MYPLFQTNDFFDPLDLPQVRYEMLRIARVDDLSVTEVCKLFGFSREYFYRLEHDFMSQGLGGGSKSLLNEQISNKQAREITGLSATKQIHGLAG